MKAINLTPYTVNVYKSDAHWDRNTPVYTESYPNRSAAEQAIKVISKYKPKYYFEIIQEA